MVSTSGNRMKDNWVLFDSEFLTCKVNMTEIGRLVTWASRFEEATQDPNIVGVNVRMVGGAMQGFFNNEGSTRKWQSLSAYTNQERINRGVPPVHPILQQKGDLKKVTADALAGWSSWRQGGSYTGPGINMTGATVNGRFTATATGPKMQNHFGQSANIAYAKAGGYKSKKGQTIGYLPARPFFGIDNSLIGDMAANSLAVLMMKWRSYGGNWVKTTGGYIRLTNQKATQKGGVRIN